MRKRSSKWKILFMLAMALSWICALSAAAGEGSNDNSLADLGILTEGAEVFPEFGYGVTEYEVRVPAGTQKLELDPIPTNGNAWIVDITGTELVDGETTVEITVEAQNGERYPYHLHVTEAGAGAAAETEPAPETEPETEPEPETEDPRYVKVDRTTLQEAENTINALKDETRSYRDRSTMLMRILYGMIAFSVVLLFIVINLLLKKKDLKEELQGYRGYDMSRMPEQYMDDGVQGRRQQRYMDDGAQERRPQRYMDDGAQERRPQQYADTGAQEREPQLQVYRPEPLIERDDPATVPKPQKAKKRPKKMPEYQQPQQQPAQSRKENGQDPQRKGKSDKVEITMIDL